MQENSVQQELRHLDPPTSILASDVYLHDLQTVEFIAKLGHIQHCHHLCIRGGEASIVERTLKQLLSWTPASPSDSTLLSTDLANI